ncbi:MAG: 2-phosphosulfolactate phosphatase [archaeon]
MRATLEVTAHGAARAAKRRDVIIVIDVLRASSTIVTALSNGAREVIPAPTLDRAREIAQSRTGSILGGEREGIKPKGFHSGNSPREYSRDLVRGRTVVLTTTSGTKALERAKGGKAILVGSLLNGRKVANAGYRLAKLNDADISIVASGKSGELSCEDLLCAGQVSHHLLRYGAILDDGCAIVSMAWEVAASDLAERIWSSHHAQYLKSIGFEEDVVFCSQVDVFDIVPVLRAGKLVPLPSD